MADPLYIDDDEQPEIEVRNESDMPEDRIASWLIRYDRSLPMTFAARIVNAAATQRFGHFIAPCSGIIQSFTVGCVVKPTHATNDLSFGIISDIDSHLDEIDITDLATGSYDFIGHANVLSRSIVAGTVYAWGWVGGDTTGELVTTMVVTPS